MAMEPQQGAILITAEQLLPVAAPLANNPPPSSETTTASSQTLSSETSNEEFSGSDGDEEEEDEYGMFTKEGRCQRCLRRLAPNWREDHRKTHYLQGTLGVAVAEANKCSRCVRKGRKCLVAKEPCRKELNTLQCEGCLDSRRCCSFKKTYKHLRVRSLRSHPARWPSF